MKDCRRVMRGEASLWPMVARTTTIRSISNSRLLNVIESNLSSMLREKTCLKMKELRDFQNEIRNPVDAQKVQVRWRTEKYIGEMSSFIPNKQSNHAQSMARAQNMKIIEVVRNTVSRYRGVKFKVKSGSPKWEFGQHFVSGVPSLCQTGKRESERTYADRDPCSNRRWLAKKNQGVQKAIFEEMVYLWKKAAQMMRAQGRSRSPQGVRSRNSGNSFSVPGTVRTCVEVGIRVKMVSVGHQISAMGMQIYKLTSRMQLLVVWSLRKWGSHSQSTGAKNRF